MASKVKEIIQSIRDLPRSEKEDILASINYARILVSGQVIRTAA